MFRYTLIAACAALAIIAGCGSSDAPNPFTEDQLQGLINELGVGAPPEPEQSVALAPADLPDYVNEAGLAQGWRAGHRVQILDALPEIERILIHAELYDDEDDANRRFEGERNAFVTFVERGFPNTLVEAFDVSDVGERCDGFSISQPAYIDQHQVHCQVGTVLITARAISEDAEVARDLAIEAATAAVRRAEAALPAESS
jgi:hypothetical protein